DVVEGDLGILLHVVAAGLALAEAHEAAARHAALRPTEEPHVKRDEKDGRPETEQQRRPQTPRLYWLGADLDAVFDKQRLESRIDEGGHGRLERKAGTGLRFGAENAGAPFPLRLLL